jgi:23S rRNA maturation-related 3'-5' exoribonuclease YhaM
VITYDLKLSPEISDKVIAESIAASSAEMSERGKLIGHIALGDEMVVRACIELKIPTTKDIILQLRHCMLSHHGKLEFGSPVAPSTHEAVLIGNIDLIQAELQGRMEIIRGLEVGGRQYDKHIKSELYRWR